MRCEGQHFERMQLGVIGPPVIFARAEDRELEGGPRGPLRVGARKVVGDVLGIDVGQLKAKLIFNAACWNVCGLVMAAGSLNCENSNAESASWK
jgi:hypothetical protein